MSCISPRFSRSLAALVNVVIVLLLAVCTVLSTQAAAPSANDPASMDASALPPVQDSVQGNGQASPTATPEYASPFDARGILPGQAGTGQWMRAALLSPCGPGGYQGRSTADAAAPPGSTDPDTSIASAPEYDYHTIIPLDGTQANRRAALSAVLEAMLEGQHPLLATHPFTLSATTCAPGTVILAGNVGGSFTRRLHTGPLALPPAWVLYPQTIALFESASLDERASWELPDLRKVLETYSSLPEWPRVDESGLASESVAADVVFFPAGVTPDVLRLFQESGAAGALDAQAERGRWFVFQGDAARLAHGHVGRAGLVPAGTVAANALEAGVLTLAALDPESILAYNWPEGMKLTRYSDAPRFYVSGSVTRVADYADGEAAIVTRRIGRGGVILIGGHASLDISSYGLLYNALFAAGAEQVDSQVSVEQQLGKSRPAFSLTNFSEQDSEKFASGPAPDVLPGLEPGIPVLVRTTLTYYGEGVVSDLVYTEVMTSGYRLLEAPTATLGSVVTAPLAAGTLITWMAETLEPGEHELRLLAANVATDTLKPGQVTISRAALRYTEVKGGQARTVQLARPDAVVRAALAALLAHDATGEPGNVYPLPPEGVYVHVRHDLENKLETRANHVVYTFTIPFVDLVRDAFDQTIFPHVTGTTDNAWVVNEIYGYPGRNYPIPRGAAGRDWRYDFFYWDGVTWVRIPNPRRVPVTIPPALQCLAFQEANDGDILVAGRTLVFDLGTVLPYDRREPAVRYAIHSRELYGEGVSFSAAPVTGTLVLEGNGGSAYVAVGQHPLPFREYLPGGAVSNPLAPAPSQIAYTDVWGRRHAVTETVRSAFYDVVPYRQGGGGEPAGLRFASTYGLTGEDGRPLFDVPAGREVTLTIRIKALSVARTLPAEQLIVQEMLPRGLGYDVEFAGWAPFGNGTPPGNGGSFRLLDEHTMRVPAFDLLYFQGDLPADEPQTVILTARLRTYPDHPREGAFLVDGGARVAAPSSDGAPYVYDTDWTHVRVEQGYQAELALDKRVTWPDVNRYGGVVYEVIHADGAADVGHFTEEVYVDSTGTGDETAVVRTGGSRGPNLYFGTVQPGGTTMLVLELTNNSGRDWRNVALAYTAPPGITLTPILTGGLEPPPNVYDSPYLWAAEVPDVSRGVYYYEVSVGESVAGGVMYPIVFTLAGDDTPGAAEFPLPVARVGVPRGGYALGGDVQQILGQARGIQLTDTAPPYSEPLAARLVPPAQLDALQAITRPESLEAFFETLTSTVPFTTALLPSPAVRLITYSLPSALQMLPAQACPEPGRRVGAEMSLEWHVLVRSRLGPVEPGSQVVNWGPRAAYEDDFGWPQVVSGEPSHVVAHGPALTGTYSVLSVTSPFYSGMVIDPIPGEEVEACVDIAIRNVGNYVASEPLVSVTLNLSAGLEIVSLAPAPLSAAGGVVTWELPDVLPYGAGGDLGRDVEHVQACLRFTPPGGSGRQSTAAYVPLLAESDACYTDEWGEMPFTVHSLLGGEYGLHVGGDLLPSPDPLSATPRDGRTVWLVWRVVAGAADYVVYRSTERDGGFRRVDPSSDGNNLTDVVFDSPMASVYYYVVRARDANQVEGRRSQVVSFYTGARLEVYLPLVMRR
jgi:hypothetical protein